MKENKLTELELSYIAGFLDGDGSLIAQIIKQKDYKYGFTIRVSINFYQKNKRNWFIKRLYKNFDKKGSIRIRKDEMCVLTITAFKEVSYYLNKLMPYLIIKKKTAILLLEIINAYAKVKTKADFLKVCILVDKVADLTDSKNRKITYEYVQNNIKDSP